MAREFDHQVAGEERVDASESTTVGAKHLLQHRSWKTGISNESEKHSLEATLAAAVDERVEQRPPTIRRGAVLFDDPSAQSVLGHQPPANGGVDGVLGFLSREAEQRRFQNQSLGAEHSEAPDALNISAFDRGSSRSHIGVATNTSLGPRYEQFEVIASESVQLQKPGAGAPGDEAVPVQIQERGGEGPQPHRFATGDCERSWTQPIEQARLRPVVAQGTCHSGSVELCQRHDRVLVGGDGRNGAESCIHRRSPWQRGVTWAAKVPETGTFAAHVSISAQNGKCPLWRGHLLPAVWGAGFTGRESWGRGDR
jgi:hypothetical protein